MIWLFSKYLVFSIFLFTGVSLLYRTITPSNVKEYNRIRFIEAIDNGKNIVKTKLSYKEFDKQLLDAGVPYFNSFRYEIIRILFVLLYVMYYILFPALNGQKLKLSVLVFLIIFYLITEYRFHNPFSLTNKILKALTAQKQKKKQIELFTLYDILKADLIALKSDQDVNIYALLKDSLPMFRHINGTLSRFLSLWLTNPEKAKNVFYEDIPTQSAKNLGDIIVNIDSMSRDEALNIIKNESSTYAEHYFKGEVIRHEKQRNFLFTLFSINILVNAIWLIALVATMLVIQLNDSNLFIK